jgi:peptidyl-dipeptidase A
MAMLRLGASKPWPDALAELSGERTMDASAILDYYAPLAAWLDEQNKGEACGWEGSLAPASTAPAPPALTPSTTAAPAPSSKAPADTAVPKIF